MFNIDFTNSYRHGGAGNNWALGYQMASGEFLQKSIDLITREIEHCDYAKTLVIMHSVAGIFSIIIYI